MVLPSLKTQDTTSNKNVNRVTDDVDEIRTQTELIVSRNAVTQTDPVIIKLCSKSIQCKNKSNIKQRKLPFNVSHVGSWPNTWFAKYKYKGS